MTKTIILVATLLVEFPAFAATEPPITTVTFRVLDETGAPVSNASIMGTSYWRPGKTKGLTDSNGIFQYDDRVYTEIGCYIEKPGYYRTRGEIWHWSGATNDHPTNALVVVLKRIKDPVPTNFRRIGAYLPKLNEPVGFDLAVGDWVVPDGKGKTSDLWFVGEKRMVSRRDHDIKVAVTFSNALEGIQEFIANDPDDVPLANDLMPTQIAPLDGYTNGVSLWQYWHPKQPLAERYRQNRCYTFRVRCKKDEKDNVAEAHYGWTRGDIKIDAEADKTIWIRFQYYYNPDPHSRSLEPKEIAARQGIYPK